MTAPADPANASSQRNGATASETHAAKASMIREDMYCGWQSLWIEQGPLTLILVPQIGGRIMSTRWNGRELSFVNPECRGRVPDVASFTDLDAAKQRLGFILWGGDKTWLAPQDHWTDGVPFLDLDSGAYDLRVDRTSGTTTMVSPVCRETGIRITRTVTLGARPGTWSVTSRLTNGSDHTVTWAPWDVDMMLRPATVFLPTSPRSTYPHGVKTFDTEGVSTSVRDDVVQVDDGIAVVSCREAIRFKYGVDADVGRILAVLESGDGLVGYRKSVPTFHPQPYGHGCVLEIFNAPAYPYIEMEVHGPVVSLQPGEDFALTVDSALFDLEAMPTTSTLRREGLGIE